MNILPAKGEAGSGDVSEHLTLKISNECRTVLPDI
jgi:hypothetical protein